MNNIYDIWFSDAVKQEIADQTVEVIDFSTEDENTEIIEQNLSGTDVMRMDSNHMQPQTSAGRVVWKFLFRVESLLVTFIFSYAEFRRNGNTVCPDTSSNTYR